MKSQRQLGEIFRQYRVKAGFSQEKLAELSGLDRTFISLIERGKRMPTVETLVMVAKALGVKPSEILKDFEEGLTDED